MKKALQIAGLATAILLTSCDKPEIENGEREERVVQTRTSAELDSFEFIREYPYRDNRSEKFPVSSIISIGRARVAKAGSLTYFLDQNRRPIAGFHEIKEHELGYVGQLGAMNYLVSPGGDVLSPGFHKIGLTEEGYVCSVGSADFNLNSRGRLVR